MLRIFGVGLAMLLAQTQAAQPPVFRSQTRLVQISVVVHDRHGQPVSDLKREDFSITERGKPQKITFFTMDSASAVAPLSTLPPHIFTNVASKRMGVPGNVTVILLDLLNTSWGDQHYAREALLKFLGQIQPQDRLALFSLGRRSLTVLHDYTSDAASLAARIRKLNGEVSPELEASTLRDDTQQELRQLGLEGIADGNQQVADFYTGARAVNTLQAFEAIAQHLAGLPGRKSIIWLSGGFPLTIGFDEIPEPGSTRDQRTFTHEMDAAIRALNNSGIAVYPVDARGLMVAPGFEASTRAAPRVGANPFPRMNAMRANIDTMNELADRTGGHAAYNTNGLSDAIRRAIDDGRVTYTLGYYSTDEAQDGRFRNIKVAVDRPHVDVRYRKGYFAMRPSDKTPETRKREIAAAVWSPLDSTAIGLNVRVDVIDHPEPNTINVFVQIDPSMLAFRQEGGRWKADLDIIYVQKDERGKMPANGVTDTISLALTGENYSKAMQEGFIHQKRFARQPTASTLRIVVRDADSGSVGSVTVPFSQVPK